ncbi:MAG: T9SS type A sorting domain-containing protein [Bacteroidales bacterium]
MKSLLTIIGLIIFNSAFAQEKNCEQNNVPCGKNKILICHIPPSNTGNPQTLCINKNALQAHKAHGDYCGPCNTQNAKTNKAKDFCGTEQNDYGDKSLNNCLISNAALCSYPASRDSFIPDESTTVRYLSLLVIVVDSNIYGVTQENVDSMVAGVNNYYNPWKIYFCYSTVFIDTSMLSQYPQNPDSISNVIIYDWPNLGISGNPIKIDYSVVLNNNYQGAYSLAHELGHNYGLLHTFTTTDYPANNIYIGCSWPCRDRVDYTTSQQDTTGDLMSDTPPTPRNYTCAPPVGVDSCSAGMPSWPAWGYENLMGYSYCPDATFTPQQAGRMHCCFEHGAMPFIDSNTYIPKLIYGMQHCSPLVTVNNLAEEKGIYFEIMPNPFNESTTISFKIPQECTVNLEVYNYLGQHISTLYNNPVNKGQENKVEFYTGNLFPGVYYAILKTNNKVLVKKMVLTK